MQTVMYLLFKLEWRRHMKSMNRIDIYIYISILLMRFGEAIFCWVAHISYKTPMDVTPAYE
jgi:hypothetical protein